MHQLLDFNSRRTRRRCQGLVKGRPRGKHKGIRARFARGKVPGVGCKALDAGRRPGEGSTGGDVGRGGRKTPWLADSTRGSPLCRTSKARPPPRPLEGRWNLSSLDPWDWSMLPRRFVGPPDPPCPYKVASALCMNFQACRIVLWQILVIPLIKLVRINLQQKL